MLCTLCVLKIDLTQDKFPRNRKLSQLPLEFHNDLTLQNLAKTAPHQEINVQNLQELKKAFVPMQIATLPSLTLNTHLTIPRLYLTALPLDFKNASHKIKKKLFIQSLLPLIIRANEYILAERAFIYTLADTLKSGKALSRHQQKQLKLIQIRYRLKTLCLNELKKRVDIVPPSLALAQAILESGWGTSLSALNKKSTFGIMVNNQTLTYDCLFESVKNYMDNINGHFLYKKMRQIRFKFRENNQKICSYALIKNMTHYSTRGHNYIFDVSNLIKRYHLQQYDNVQFINHIESEI